MSPAPRRRTPRPMDAVLSDVMAKLAPTDPLARLQAAWAQLAGARAASTSAPTRLRPDGVFVVQCDSGPAAADLQLRKDVLQELASEHLGMRVELHIQGPGRRRR